MKSERLLILLSLLFFLAAGAALMVVLPMHNAPLEPVAPAPVQKSSVLWRLKSPFLSNPPTRLSDGWLLTTRKGEIISLTEEGTIRWKLRETNAIWQAATQIDKETLCAVTQAGELFTFNASTGTLRWKLETGASSCWHAPLVTSWKEDILLILVSQGDGILNCLDAKDGTLRWRGEPTNQTDSPVIRIADQLVYGNCDSTVYFFSMTNGLLEAKIVLKPDEQIAGPLLPLPTGQLVVPTQAGTLVLLDPLLMTCIARQPICRSYELETIHTPILISHEHFVMPTPDGKLTFWNWQPTNLVSAGELQLASRIDQIALQEGVLWCFADRKIIALRVHDKKILVQFSPGDNLEGLSPGSDGRCLVSVDGELLCIKGF